MAEINIVNILRHLKIHRSSKIIQFGLKNNQALIKLYVSGYKNLYGIDTNKKVYDLELNTSIRYLYGNLKNTHLPNEFFDVVILSSDFKNSKEILNESKRILKTGGLLLYKASMKNHFNPKGSYNTNILIKGKEAKTFSKNLPNDISILSYTKKFGGIYEYTALLAERLRSEYKMNVHISYDVKDISSKDVIVECAPGVIDPSTVIRDIKLLKSSNHKIYVDVHDVNFRKFSKEERKLLESLATLMYRANELADVDGIKKYTLFPLIAYKSVGLKIPKIGIHERCETF